MPRKPPAIEYRFEYGCRLPPDATEEEKRKNNARLWNKCKEIIERSYALQMAEQQLAEKEKIAG
ncbi:hypothetical protein GJ688_01860 [Heliobacillus mobilis]|uniref:Uncharacterized protein n=1 Tax=Heliobacterium mobile TaxID=28064 RepID=A0A6I3SBC2_HELMO|nr:hypothetical protein [Heliobacterium mobile]MTV47727.1 hypothetical protein [Heliobacterium mobile]